MVGVAAMEEIGPKTEVWDNQTPTPPPPADLEVTGFPRGARCPALPDSSQRAGAAFGRGACPGRANRTIATS